jgi:hypothetical protein
MIFFGAISLSEMPFQVTYPPETRLHNVSGSGLPRSQPLVI